jgi:hypothetical protein
MALPEEFVFITLREQTQKLLYTFQMSNLMVLVCLAVEAPRILYVHQSHWFVECEVSMSKCPANAFETCTLPNTGRAGTA